MDRYQPGDAVTPTDVMVWALLSRRTKIAFLAWTKTEVPIHTALLACLLSRSMENQEGCGADATEQRQQFETLAIEVMNKYETYEDIEPILKYQWDGLCGWDAIKIARYCEVVTPHWQKRSFLQ